MATSIGMKNIMSRLLILAAAVCLSLIGQSFGQAPQKPGPEHAKLQEFVGEWDAVMTMGDQQSKATAVYRSVCNGMWVESDFQGSVGDQKFSGRGMDGYDIARKKYTGSWFDSMSSAPMHFEGEYDPKSKMMVMTGESLGPDGKPMKFKNTTEMKDKDHFTFKMYMVPPTGEDQLAFTINYTRKK
jgi:hypothetical protein